MISGVRQKVVVKPGGVIELQSAELPVGATVEVIVLVDATAGKPRTTHPLSQLSKEQRIAKIRESLGGWKDDPEITEIFAEIDRERHAYQGRPSRHL